MSKSYEKLFSGAESVELWAEINCVVDRATSNALYSLMCKLQTMEEKLDKLEKKPRKEKP